MELDRAIAMLPASLGNAVREVYGTRSTMLEHARRLGCPETLLVRRIGRAHRLLIDILETLVCDDALARERGVMRGRLSTVPDPSR